MVLLGKAILEFSQHIFSGTEMHEPRSIKGEKMVKMYIAMCNVHQGTLNDVYKALQAQEKEQWCRQQANICNYKNIFQNVFEIEEAATNTS